MDMDSNKIRNIKIKPQNIKDGLSALKNSFYTTKRSRIAAGVITALLLIAVIFYRRLFFAEESGALLFAAALAGSFVVGLLTAFHVKVSNKAAKIINPVI